MAALITFTVLGSDRDEIERALETLSLSASVLAQAGVTSTIRVEDVEEKSPVQRINIHH